LTILDVRTIPIGLVISDAICALVIGSLWLWYHRRSPELGRWTARFTPQIVSFLCIVLRGPSRRNAYGFRSSVQAVGEGDRRRCLRRLGALPSCTFSIFGFTNYMCCRIGAFRSQLTKSLVRS
jgi:hypothetical protein